MTHTPAPWKCKDSKGRYLSDNTLWEADYKGKARSTTSLPILAGKVTVALCVGIDTHWEDETANRNAEFIVKAVNNHESLLEALRIVLYSGSLDGIVPHNIIDKVRDAVTKAEGM